MGNNSVITPSDLILITGARGFFGHHAAKYFSKLGCRVVGLGHGIWPLQDSKLWGVSEWRNAEVTHANLDALSASCGLPTAVIHLAGGSVVGPSFSQPAEDFRRTVLATCNLTEWLRLRVPKARLVMASSAAVYGSGYTDAIKESDPSHPYSPYGFHKRMAELVLESYAKNFGLQVSAIRFFSVYGPGLMKQLFWEICSQLMANPTQLTLGGTGNELRDWLHVEDAAQLLATALESASTEYSVLNGGTGIATSVRDIVTILCQCWGTRNLPIIFSGNARRGDPISLVAEVSAANSLGWKAQKELHAGIADYVNWFKTRQESNAS